MGNILGLANNVAVPPPNVFGGPTNQSFAYDDLYRLTHAEGTFQFSPSKSHTYTMDMVYDTIHNIALKNQLHTIIQPSTQAVTQKKTSYNFAYAYNPSGANSLRPHAPTHIDLRTYTYDLDGNQTGWTHDTNGTRRTITWDEEDRIQNVADNGQTKDYKYDDKGHRMIKRGPQGETVYVNQFFTDRPGATGTKHVYAGTTRIASKLLRQDTPNSNPNGNTPFEKDLYFYHPDHIGSTNYVTDLNGKLYEHLEYFPFGEAWVEENSNQQRTPFLFTAKELDEETGLYYFGARYYDPRTSVWQSADPIFWKYLPTGISERDRNLPGMGGVFKSVNLATYSYAGLSPLVHIDPDGEKLVRIILDTPEARMYIQFQNQKQTGRGIVVEEKWAPAVTAFLNKMIEKKISVQINSTFRTTAEQNVERQSNPLATQGPSAHEGGLAVDFSVRKDPKGSWLNPEAVPGVEAAARSQGMRWGPDFSDPPHVDAALGGVFGYASRQAAITENQGDWSKNSQNLPTTPLSGRPSDPPITPRESCGCGD